MKKKLLITTAIFEVITGILLMAAPLMVVPLLLGEETLGNVSITIGRIAGAALISIAIVCWFSRQEPNVYEIVYGLLFYNIAVAVVLFYGRFGLDLEGIGLVPAIITHIILTVWCIIVVQKNQAPNKSIPLKKNSL